MKRKLRVNSHLALVAFACVALAGATAYFLEVMPRREVTPGTPIEPANSDFFTRQVSWVTAFATQCFAFLTFVCPVAAHALSGRWSWSVRLFTAISAYAGFGMAMMGVNAYEDVPRASGYIHTEEGLLEGAMVMASIFVFYALFTLCTLTWIATRGRRFGPTTAPH